MVTVTDAFLVYSLMKRLVMPFNRWPAYQRGIIDAQGNVLKPRSTLTPMEQRDWGRFDIMVANLKKLINKVPGGSSMIGSAAAAAFLFKECKDLQEDDNILLEQRFNEHFNILNEEAPANAAGTGAAIAGLDNNPPGRKMTLSRLRKVIRRRYPHQAN